MTATTQLLTVRAKPPRSRNKAASSPLSTALAYLTGVVIIIITIVPLLFIFIGGFRTTPQINNDPTGLPHPWIWTNYRIIVTSHVFWHFLMNSALIAIIATTLAVSLGAMAAFALSRYTFKGRDAIFSFFMIGLLFPLTVASLPLYLLLRDLGLLENMFDPHSAAVHARDSGRTRRCGSHRRHK
jgi:raffinose/stachyose/melibiose transport system permease protein